MSQTVDRTGQVASHPGGGVGAAARPGLFINARTSGQTASEMGRERKRAGMTLGFGQLVAVLALSRVPAAGAALRCRGCTAGPVSVCCAVTQGSVRPPLESRFLGFLPVSSFSIIYPNLL